MFEIDSILPKRNEALVARRYGKILYTKELLETQPEAIQKLFTKLIPVDLKYDFPREIFELTALSDEFDPTEIAEIIPQYHVMIRFQKSKKKTSGAYYFKFIKADLT